MTDHLNPTEGGKWLEQGGKLVRDTGEQPAREKAPESDNAGPSNPAPVKPSKARGKASSKE